MKLLELTISKPFDKKKFKFTDITLIFSRKNSVGKTTLIRMLLYALGYPIPSSKGITFGSYSYELKILTDSNRELVLHREGTELTVYEFSQRVNRFTLPIEELALHKMIFEIENELVINNLLATFYIDQEKGWTLLNRGKIIGNIRFNIEDLVLGLSDRSDYGLKEKIRELEKEIKRYSMIYNTAIYKEQILKEHGPISKELEPTVETAAHMTLLLELQALTNELSRVNKVINGNIRFIDFIRNLKLYVIDFQGNEIPVNENTIKGFSDDEDYLLERQSQLKWEIQGIKKQLEPFEEKKDSKDKLFDIQSTGDIFDSAIAKLDIKQSSIDKVLKGLQSELKRTREHLREVLKTNNDITSEMHKTILKYTNELEISEHILPPENDLLFTRDLVPYSGAILHKIVFAYNLAYIDIIKKKFGKRTPIIIDSPKSREISDEEVGKMMSVLYRDFSDHQIIIASIHSYSIGYDNQLIIENQLLGF